MIPMSMAVFPRIKASFFGLDWRLLSISFLDFDNITIVEYTFQAGEIGMYSTFSTAPSLAPSLLLAGKR